MSSIDSTSTTSSQISIHPKSTSSSVSHHLIYYITGNPGLIGYYNTFLQSLHPLLGASDPQVIYHIHGQSLAGFVDLLSSTRTTPYSLEEQIVFSLSTLQSQRIPSGPQEGQHYQSVILIGHSVGSYILLELIKRLGKSSPVKIKAGILLFPTITHIAKSPSGARLSTLFRIPNFPRKAGTVAKALVLLTPTNALRWLVGLVTRMPREAAEVTTSFLRSRMGVWQALHMAKDEMDIITEDRWDDNIWGAEHEDLDTKSETPKLIFYFGQNDHWVADHTRDALIAARGREEGARKSSKPVMLIDNSGIPHGFCIRHSETVAEKVGLWINELMADTRRRW
ncbi:hypothetical protein QTJ16_001073 [Diplocarpon rosae]|uniref:Lipid droplet-associated hydrolase n=1 Tax=Diplocarpon rosae TaxID=946125 RepID=A0AAD9T7A2_9HELO|nr:hypothetical protein QTJ16_001073 [Diplocarpon rosae]